MNNITKKKKKGSKISEQTAPGKMYRMANKHMKMHSISCASRGFAK